MSMSLLSTVEQAIKSCKAEQARINSTIQIYREILQSITSQPKVGYEESNSADDADTETGGSPGEREDLELLERALEKALQVRTGAGPSAKDSNQRTAPEREPGDVAVTSKEGMQASAASRGNRPTTRLTSRSARLDREKHKKPTTSASSTLSSKASYTPGGCKTTVNGNAVQNCLVSSAGPVQSQRAASVSGGVDLGQLHTSALHSKNKTIRSNVLSGSDLGKAAVISTASSNNKTPVSHTGQTGAHRVPHQNGIASHQTAKWKSLKRKQNRLWDKVAALQRNPVPGRSRFTERVRSMFPKDWPCGSPDQTRVLVGRLTQQGRDLTHCCQTKELLAQQTPEAATELGGETLEGFQMTAAELQNFAVQVKKEWEAWDRWRPEGGCLCPTVINGLLGHGMIGLPPTITYSTEAELRELENLRMRVALLQQEMYLEQALLDTLAPQLSSVVIRPESLSISVLRDVYSLLGEGGQRFPAVVLDSERD
uniref:uncharacterized protein LOC124073779 isoform X1 n=1 Tax=Scatophagus argus TaxID=75038 RepID=UPI001ED7F2CA|nr:uncharacterized protein LOC124073779 isoform X1 [Scatophagus argus]